MASDDAPLTADELEQRRPAVPEPADPALDGDERPLTPDELEQRQETGWEDEPRDRDG